MSLVAGMFASLGRPGMFGIGLLVFCGTFHAGTLMPLREELTRLETATAEFERKAAPAPPLSPVSIEPIRKLPPPGEVPRLIGRIQSLAERLNLALDRPTYQVTQDERSRFVDYEISLAVKGGYPDVKAFIDELGDDDAAPALLGLAIRRARAADPAVEAQLRLGASFRAAP